MPAVHIAGSSGRHFYTGWFPVPIFIFVPDKSFKPEKGVFKELVTTEASGLENLKPGLPTVFPNYKNVFIICFVLNLTLIYLDFQVLYI